METPWQPRTTRKIRPTRDALAAALIVVLSAFIGVGGVWYAAQEHLRRRAEAAGLVPGSVPSDPEPQTAGAATEAPGAAAAGKPRRKLNVANPPEILGAGRAVRAEGERSEPGVDEGSAGQGGGVAAASAAGAAGSAGAAVGASSAGEMRTQEAWREVIDRAAVISAAPSGVAGLLVGLVVYRQRRAERRAGLLRDEAESRLRLMEGVVEYAEDVIVVSDGDLGAGEGPHIVYVNPAFTRVTGFAPGEVIGRSVEMLRGLKTDKGESERVRAAMAKGEAVRAELVQYAKDGREFWSEMAVVPLRGPSGDVVNFVSVHRESTARRVEQEKARRTVNELGRARAGLEARVAELTAANQALVAQQERAAHVGVQAAKLVASVQREMRTPLTAVAFAASVMRDTGATPQEREDAARVAAGASGHLLEVARDVSDLAQLEGQVAASVAGECDPRSELEQAVGMLRVEAERKGLRLAIRLEEPFPAALCVDMTRVRCAVLHLLENSVRYTEHGGVCLSAEVIRDGGQDAGRLRVRVEDTGPGVEEGTLARALGGRAGERGRGSGLMVARHLCEALGGRLTAHSTAGYGSVFTAEFAVSGIGFARAAERAAADAPRLSGRVLLAEDHADLRAMLQTVLTRAGARVDVAGNGEQAFAAASRAAAQHDPYDLVLMDTHMPLLDGRSAVERLRMLGYMGMVVALCGDGAEERQRCLDAGCNEVLVKPLTPEALLAAVLRMLREAKASAKQRAA
ncbi:MAG: hypothetical protein C0468_04265 [Planctomyces sp.]|nr:hypothetical protein [Planctomyces sp.]